MHRGCKTQSRRAGRLKPRHAKDGAATHAACRMPRLSVGQHALVGGKRKEWPYTLIRVQYPLTRSPARPHPQPAPPGPGSTNGRGESPSAGVHTV